MQGQKSDQWLPKDGWVFWWQGDKEEWDYKGTQGTSWVMDKFIQIVVIILNFIQMSENALNFIYSTKQPNKK